MADTIFKFRKTDQIGAMSAEQDLDYLVRCFVDTGELALDYISRKALPSFTMAVSGSKVMITRAPLLLSAFL